jgi:hypothetical protein
MPPQTAFLILAHEHPGHLGRLVRRLAHPQARTFVHVDGKQPLAPFQEAVGDHAHLLEDADRIPAYWGAFSVIRATFNLLRRAVALAPRTERFFLISGVDYPLLPVDRILEALRPDRELIQVDRALDPRGSTKFDRNAYRLFLGENRYLNPRTGPQWLQGVRFVIARMPRWKAYPGTVFYGPPHWALTRAAVDYLLAAEHEGDRVKWFRHTLYPDEMVFQTLLKHSPFAGRMAYDGTARSRDWHPRRAGPNYIDWENPNPNLPRALELSDLPELQASGAFFARKMHPERSAKLLDALDALSPAENEPLGGTYPGTRKK